MAINFFSEGIQFSLENSTIVKQWITSVIAHNEASPGTINYVFCGDEYLLEINKKFLDHDTYTDIITFDYSAGSVISGDIFISIDRVNDNAIKYHTTFNNELHRVIIHGILHLCGYNDKTEVEQDSMRKLEDKYLSLIPVGE